MAKVPALPLRRRPERPPPAKPWDRAAAFVFDAAVVLAVVATPLAMGGRHPFGQAVLTAAALAAMASWTMRACRGDGLWRFGALDALVIAGMAIGVLQAFPLPPSWVEAISPRLLSLLPRLDGGPRSVGRWDCLSIVPGETLACLGILLSQGVFAAVLVQRIRSVADVERILRTAVCGLAIVAGLGIVQYLFGNDRYLWFYEFAHNGAGGAVKATFTNRNHFAGFLAIGSGAVLVRALAAPPRASGAWNKPFLPRLAGGEWSDRQRLGGWLVLAVVAFAAVLSLSRGGCVAAAIGLLVAAGCLARSATLRMSSIVGLAAAGIVVTVALGIHGWDRLAVRFEALASAFGNAGPEAGDLKRLTVWRAACRVIGDFPWLGTGAGSHADISPLVMPPTGGVVFTHAENSFLNVGVETGFVGLVVVLTALVAACAAAGVLVARGEPRERQVGAAVAAGLAAGVVHALVDFTWYVPACSTLMVTLGACGVGLASRRGAWLPVIDVRLGRHAAFLVGAGIVALLCGSAVRQVAAGRAEHFWEESIKQARAYETAAWRQSTGRDPVSADDATRLLAMLDARIAALERCLSLRPDHPRACSALAIARLERFGCAQLAAGQALGLVDFRLASAQARFPSQRELVAWVRRAAGARAADLERGLGDAARAVRIAPLSGEAWCALGQLAFLAGRPGAAADFVAQALLVRPADSVVLFEAANQAVLDGDTERAQALWQASFQADGRQRARIIAILVPHLSSADACGLLEPDLDGLRAIEAAWGGRETPEALREVRERRLAGVRSMAEAGRAQPAAACRLLMEAASLEQRLGRPAEACATLQAAVRADPTSFDAHLAAADAALAVADSTLARRELEWCLLRRPDRADLREKLGNLQGRAGIEGPTAARAWPVMMRRERVSQE